MSRNGAARMNSSGIIVLNSMCSSSPLHKSIARHPSFKQFSLVSQLKEFRIVDIVNGVIAKDLRLFRRDLSKLVPIDNSSHTFALQLANGLLISMWTDD
jgi:TFIIF-interacting CTD phosphatase-like protein